jgi:DNA polymerase/3'-5' exonuclease PolX
MNAEIISIIERLAHIADLRGDTHREKAYRAAILGISSLKWSILAEPARIETEKIPGVGKGIKNKLLEYVRTGKVAELIDLEGSKDVRAYSELSKIAGVGPKTAANWIRSGIYTLADLRTMLAQGKIELTHVQKYGLTYYADLNERIAREEVAQIGRDIIAEVMKLDPNALAEIVGSYRRGSETSGDIDIITCGKYSLKDLCAIYCKKPHFIDNFSIGNERWTFIYKSPMTGKVRQIDVLKLPPAQYWSGLLYFTGSWEFNAAMRGYAKMQGYLLNQRGLFRLRGKTETLVKVKSEEEIFDVLRLKYVPPELRNGRADIVEKK